MDKANRNLIVSMVVIAVIIIGGYASLVVYTGFTSPFSVVMSQSMQHDANQSELGSIDTGDIVLVMDPSKCEIQSYVEGTQTGYKSFGDYGSVIIYNRGEGQNPVIHRIILWLEYDPLNDTWSAPSLQGYNGVWRCEYEGSYHYDLGNLHGTLIFENITASGKTVSIDLDSLEKSSGFLTMGDNNITNNYFDQLEIIDHLVSYDDIRSIPVMEIPWLGSIKILMNGGNNLQYVPNSLPTLVMCFALLFGILTLIDSISLFKNESYIRCGLVRIAQWKR